MANQLLCLAKKIYQIRRTYRWRYLAIDVSGAALIAVESGHYDVCTKK